MWMRRAKACRRMAVPHAVGTRGNGSGRCIFGSFGECKTRNWGPAMLGDGKGVQRAVRRHCIVDCACAEISTRLQVNWVIQRNPNCKCQFNEYWGGIKVGRPPTPLSQHGLAGHQPHRVAGHKPPRHRPQPGWLAACRHSHFPTLSSGRCPLGRMGGGRDRAKTNI